MSGKVVFTDEQGNCATYRFASAGDESGDAWVSICERAQRRLGLEESDEAKRAWPALKALAAARAKAWKAKQGDKG